MLTKDSPEILRLRREISDRERVIRDLIRRDEAREILTPELREVTTTAALAQ